MEYNYITLGYDCSTATALRNLNLRKFSLPFDWIVSSPSGIIDCLTEDFKQFHTNLFINHSKTRIIDNYGFEYPHDYPTVKNMDIDSVGNGVFEENVILDGWEEHISTNLEKYKRRIYRFIDLMKDDKNILILYRGNVGNAIRFKNFFKEKYGKENIFFLVATKEEYENEFIFTCDPEKNGKWNETEIWKNSLDILKRKI